MPIKVHSSEEARINGSKGGKASVEARRKKKTLSEFVKAWAEREPSDHDKAVLSKLFPNDPDVSNKALLVIPLIKKANGGDVKAIEMLMRLLGEERKYEAEIQKLKTEIELLKQGGSMLPERIIINMDVKKDE